jgi:hypothetical protein
VLWSARDTEHALLVAYTRISSIVFAVLLLSVLAVLIYPKIASEQVC